MEKKLKIAFWTSTGLLTGLMGMSIFAYLFSHEEASQNFLAFGHPPHIIYPLAVAKTLGLITIWTKGFPVLKEWAYAGFTFNILIALAAHIAVGDDLVAIPVVALILLAISYGTYKKLRTFQ